MPPLVNFVHDGKSIDYTPGSAVAAGAVVVQAELVGVAKLPIAANKLGSLAVEGVFDFPKATGASTAIAAGDVVYWDVADQSRTCSTRSNTSIWLCVDWWQEPTYGNTQTSAHAQAEDVAGTYDRSIDGCMSRCRDLR